MKHFFLSLYLLLGISISVESQDFYDISTISTIELTFEESNWDAILDTYKANDNDEKLLGTAVVNGEKFDSVGVKYKGNSTYSANNSKNPLHIYLDYKINQDYDGYESIKLSNGKKDPSFVREVLSYEIARKYMKAPLSNYAMVYINGSYYGMFSSSEAINGDFVDRRIFADNDNTRIKCNPQNTFAGGPSLEYLGTDSSSYYSYYEMKSDYGWQDLIDFTNTIENNPAEIESILDVDHAIWMLAFNNVLVNLDSYTGAFKQNYYLIKDDNDRFVPVIWDLNESLGAFTMIDMGGGGRPGPPGTETTSLDEMDLFLREAEDSYPLLKMIFDNVRYKKMYVAHCRTMLDENFVSGWYSAKADSLQDIIADDLADDPNAFYSTSQFTGNINSTQDRVTGITELMEGRISYLQGLAAFNYTQPTISNIVTPDEALPYTTITVTADISNANYAYLAYRHSKDEAFTKLEIFDDGEHNDGAASDGTYGINFEIDESNTHFYIYAENSEAGIFSPQRAEHEYYKIKAEAKINITSDIVINEVLASNTTVSADNSDEYDDWVELYNNTDTDISLAGYYLTDDDGDIMQWAFPDTVIPAYSYLIVWADKDEEQGSMHTNFKLSADGESVYLVNADLEIINGTDFERQYEDYSLSRSPNGAGDFIIQGATYAFNNDDTHITNEEIDFPSSVENNISLDFNVYPNPVSDILNISLADESQSINEITVVNYVGQIYFTEQISNKNNIKLNTGSWPNGLYILVLNMGSEIYTTKFIKK